MKKSIILVLLFLGCLSLLKAQENPTPCLTHLPADTSGIPKYLRPGWGQPYTAQVVICFVDFPDGRYKDVNDSLKQPLDLTQLSLVEHYDASGEVGLSPEYNRFFIGYNNITNQNLYLKPAKYSWKDRWNLYFTTDATFTGTLNPDYISNGDLAYGSFSDYWKEVSNGKFTISPAITHPYAPNDTLRSGILNNYILMPDGRYIINYLMLPLKKYGTSVDSAYFPNGARYSFGPDSTWNQDVSRIQLMQAHCLIAARNRNIFPDFDIDAFMSSGGTVIFVIAGGHHTFKGMGDWTNPFTLIRGRSDTLDNPYSSFNGIAVTAHEFAHITPHLNWHLHTNGGRYCIMDCFDVHDRNCPQHPSPYLKIKEGWLSAIPIEHSQDNVIIPPVETSHQCGILTVYGKPCFDSTLSTGEYYILENRRRLGFDSKIISSMPSDFKGGLLVWHYSPYNNTVPLSVDTVYWDVIKNCQLRAPYEFSGGPHGDSVCLVPTSGNSDHFFAWKSGLPDVNYYKYDSTRTYSSFGLKTGLSIKNITNDEGSFSGNITLNINYEIHDPPNYTYVINGGNNESSVINLHDTVYYHNLQTNSAFSLAPRTVLETAAKTFQLNGIEAYGNSGNNINFQGAGYLNYRVPVCSAISLATSSLQDSLILSYCNFRNLDGRIVLNVSSVIPNIPILINNINLPDTSLILRLDASINPAYCGYLSKFENNTVGNIELYGYWKFYLNNNFLIDTNCNFNLYGKEGTNSTIIDFITGGDIICNGLMNINSNFKTNANVFIDSPGRYKCYTSSKSGAVLIKFSAGKGIVCYGDFYSINDFPSLSTRLDYDVDEGGGFWNGISCIMPQNVLLNNINILHAETGVNITELNSSKLNILGSTFTSDDLADIIVHYVGDDGSPSYISRNVFSDSGSQYFSIGLHSVTNMNVDSNLFNNVIGDGLFLDQSSDLKIVGNSIYASLQPSVPTPAGIHSYMSDGIFGCNYITNFYDGIILDNSSPYLFNNNIWNNGRGLYLTNNSTAIMSPSYSSNSNLFNAGYNKIYNNQFDEIYCDNNWGFYFNSPYIRDGYNAIYDTNDYPLINCDLIQFNDTIQGRSNFWGDVPVDQMFVPTGCVNYSNYLTRITTFENCSPYINSSNNDGMDQSVLLFGSANISAYSGNYSSAINSYKQYLNANNNILNPVAATKIFKTGVKANSNFSELATYYQDMASSHSNDTAYFKHLRNLMIGSHVQETLYEQAISEYQNIINNSQNPQEIYYATIEQTRTIELMMDTLLHHEGGDNVGKNNYTNQQLTGLINGLINNDFTSSNLTSQSKTKNDNSVTKDKAIKNSKTESVTKPTKQQSNNKTVNGKNNKSMNLSKNVAVDDKELGSILQTPKVNLSKQNSINALKQKIIPKNLNLINLKKPELINLLRKVVTLKLLERALLNYTPDTRPLTRILPNNNGKFNNQNGLINLPKEFKLYQNYPNPFNPLTKISYDLPKDCKVTIIVYDMLGREMTKLVSSELKKAGSYIVEFNGSVYASGVYFYRIVADKYVQVKKMVLIK